jgi:hypothetical protein
MASGTAGNVRHRPANRRDVVLAWMFFAVDGIKNAGRRSSRSALEEEKF